MCTLHADEVDSAVQRLTSKPMDVAPIHIKFLDLMFVVRNTSVTDPVTKKDVQEPQGAFRDRNHRLQQVQQDL